MTSVANSRVLLLALSIFAPFIPTQHRVDRPYVHTRVLGPFTVGKDHPMSIRVRITQVHLGRDASDWPDSDTLLVVVDSSGRRLYRQSAYTALGGAETRFGCSQVYIPTIGNVLQCTASIAPTVARDGEEVRLFSVDSRHRFVPLTALIGQFGYKIVFLDSRTRRSPVLVDSSLPYAKPAIEVRYWTGYYDATVYYHVYPEGFSPTKHRNFFHFEQIPVSVDTERINWGRHEYAKGDVRVSLFPSPALDPSRIQEVTVKPNSKIEYLYASYVHGWWLFVSIDGCKGYLEESCYPRLGFDETDATTVMLGDDY